jgi:hypothetical protein
VVSCAAPSAAAIGSVTFAVSNNNNDFTTNAFSYLYQGHCRFIRLCG